MRLDGFAALNPSRPRVSRAQQSRTQAISESSDQSTSKKLVFAQRVVSRFLIIQEVVDFPDHPFEKTESLTNHDRLSELEGES
jgi:hypothetical protein